MLTDKLQTVDFVCLGIVFVLLFISFVFIVKNIHLKKTAKDISQRMLEKAIHSENVRQQKFEELLRENGTVENAGFLNKLESMLIYSGLKKADSKYPTEIVLMLCAAFVIVISAVTIAVTKNLIYGIWMLMGLPFAAYAFMAAKINIICKKIQSQMVVFLEHANSFNNSSGDIVHIYMQTAQYVESPLKEYLQDFYREAIYGDKKRAFENLEKKIAYKKLREVIHNTYMCSLYDSDYRSIFDNAQENMKVYMKGKRAIDSLKMAVRIDIFVLIIVSVVALKAFGVFTTSGSSIKELTESTVGILGLLLFGFITLYGLYEVFKPEKN